MKPYAILLAAGTGSRTGLSMPKQLIKIKNKEIILHSLEIFLNSKINFEAIIIAVPHSSVFNFDWNNFLQKNVSASKIKKLHIITGGAVRQESVHNSVKYIENILPPSGGENTAVFIHDSARPFVMDKELLLLLEKTMSYGAAFLCSGVTETIKEISPESEKEIKKSVPVKLRTIRRDNLISAKTPQVFKFGIIKKALEEAVCINFISTDDISLAENLGFNAVPILSTDFNIKITSSLDIEIAELLFDKFKRDKPQN